MIDIDSIALIINFTCIALVSIVFAVFIIVILANWAATDFSQANNNSLNESLLSNNNNTSKNLHSNNLSHISIHSINNSDALKQAEQSSYQPMSAN